MSSSSIPTTPVTQRHQFEQQNRNSRIPLPSPQTLRRSLSLRLRDDSTSTKLHQHFSDPIVSSTSNNRKNNHAIRSYSIKSGGSSGSGNGVSSVGGGGGGRGCGGIYTSKSLGTTPTSPFTTTTIRNTTTNRNFCEEKIISNSKSLSFIGSMSHCYENDGIGGHGDESKEISSTLQNGNKIHNKIGQTTPSNNTKSTTVQQNSINNKRQQYSTNGTTNQENGMSLNLKECDSSSTAATAAGGTHHRRQSSSMNGGGGGASGSNRLYSQNTVQSPLSPSGNGCNQQIPLKLSPKTPPVSPDEPDCCYNRDDDDLDSMYSYTSMASGRSTMSCDHPFVARNGTTFSGRKMKYVVHCSSYAGQTGEDYLTPTQRAQKHIRRLKMLLSQAHMDIEQRDSEILRLTKEVVELRLFKASLCSPDERSNSSDAVTVRENDLKTSTDVSPIIDQIDDSGLMVSSIKLSPETSPIHNHNHHHGGVLLSTGIGNIQYLDKMTNSEMQSSFADSGHFEDLTTASINSKDSFVQTHDVGCGADASSNSSSSNNNSNKPELVKFYEQKIEELIKNHSEEYQEAKITHNERVEALLHKLAECNTRYADLVPDYDQAKEKIRELESQLEELQQKLQEQEDKQNKMYLHMFTKGQEAERIAHADQVLECASNESTSSRVSVPELMQQLQVTQNELENIKDTNYVVERGSAQVLLSAKEAISLWLLGARKTMYRRLIDAQQTKNKVDPEVTLQFLKSAIYYFLTDKENTQGHLNAIESILGFSDKEKLTIDRARSAK